MRIRTAHANDCVSYVVRITSESHPRDARLTARRSNGSALHTLDHQFSKSRAQKVAAQTRILTGLPDPGQGGLVVEDTPCPKPRWAERGAGRGSPSATKIRSRSGRPPARSWPNPTP